MSLFLGRFPGWLSYVAWGSANRNTWGDSCREAAVSQKPMKRVWFICDHHGHYNIWKDDWSFRNDTEPGPMWKFQSIDFMENPSQTAKTAHPPAKKKPTQITTFSGFPSQTLHGGQFFKPRGEIGHVFLWRPSDHYRFHGWNGSGVAPQRCRFVALKKPLPKQRLPQMAGWWFQKFFIFTYLGKWSNLTNIFQMGSNHQLDGVSSWI